MKNIKHILLIVFFLNGIPINAQYNWIKNLEPVLNNGPAGSWNGNMFEASVLFNTDSSRFEMWFGASVGSYICEIGYASSIDGYNWDVHPVPVLSTSPESWDNYTVEFPVVLRENGEYKMWYSSGGPIFSQYKTGYATSTDGINWTKDTIHSPVFGPGTNSWESGSVFFNSILPYEGGYKLWYSGLTNNLVDGKTCIGYATSPDGLTWFRDTLNNPILEPGDEGEWDDTWIYCPQVVKVDNTYFMYYTGAATNSFLIGKLMVGLAISTDGISWQKYADNPVIKNSDLGWDISVESGGILKKDDSLYMYFDALGNVSGLKWQIGLAKTMIPTSIDEESNSIIPSGYRLYQNYPNPFNPETFISYDLPVNSIVNIKIYDILGNEIETLIRQEKPAGKHDLRWNAENLSSGMYLCRITAGNYNAVIKMVLLR